MNKIYKYSEEIKEDILTISLAINDYYKTHKLEKPLLVIPVFNSSMLFAADLFRELEFDCELDIMKVSSYRDNKQQSNIQIDLFPKSYNIAGRDILLIEDIIDSGQSIKKILGIMQTYDSCLDETVYDKSIFQNPRSIKVCSLINRPAKRITETKNIKPNWTVYTEDKEMGYIYGYGMDDNGLKRNFKHLWIKNTT